MVEVARREQLRGVLKHEIDSIVLGDGDGSGGFRQVVSGLRQATKRFDLPRLESEEANQFAQMKTLEFVRASRDELVSIGILRKPNDNGISEIPQVLSRESLARLAQMNGAVEAQFEALANKVKKYFLAGNKNRDAFLDVGNTHNIMCVWADMNYSWTMVIVSRDGKEFKSAQPRVVQVSQLNLKPYKRVKFK